MSSMRGPGDIVRDLERDLQEEERLLHALEQDLSTEERILHRMEAEFEELRGTLSLEPAPERPTDRSRVLTTLLVSAFVALAGFGIGVTVEQLTTDDLRADVVAAEGRAAELVRLVGATYDDSGLYTSFREATGYRILDPSGLYTEFREASGW